MCRLHKEVFFLGMNLLAGAPCLKIVDRLNS
jgi:hypothetical protein